MRKDYCVSKVMVDQMFPEKDLKFKKWFRMIMLKNILISIVEYKCKNILRD